MFTEILLALKTLTVAKEAIEVRKFSLSIDVVGEARRSLNVAAHYSKRCRIVGSSNGENEMRLLVQLNEVVSER